MGFVCTSIEHEQHCLQLMGLNTLPPSVSVVVGMDGGAFEGLPIFLGAPFLGALNPFARPWNSSIFNPWKATI
jgi:hypothetical protein